MKVKIRSQINENYGENLLKNRGIYQVNEYINPTEDFLNYCGDLSCIAFGAALLEEKLKEEKEILFIVDCDVDGFTSSAILWQYIKRIAPQKNLSFKLHSGKQHGFEDLIEEILEEQDKYSLIICPDAGTNDAQYCSQLKIPVLVLDHHLKETEPSENMIVINNHIGETYTNKDLTGAGVVWQFCKYYDKYHIEDGKGVDDLIDLAALGICADMGSVLSYENRYIMKKGFENVNNYFFKVLIDKQSFSMGGEVTPITVAFYIVPMINAMIRVGSMEEKTRLFLAFIDGHMMVPCNKRGAKGTMEEVAVESARECTNAKSKQNKIKESAVEKLEIKIHKYDLLENKILFVKLEEDDDFPAVLNGLIATQLSAKFSKPTIVARLGDDGKIKGSIRGLNQSELTSFKDFLTESKYFDYVMGHDNAAGCGLPEANYFKVLEYANKNLANIDFGENVYEVDFSRAAQAKDIEDIIYDLDRYRSVWGQNNSEPLIHIHNLKVNKNDIQIMGKNQDTLKFVYNGIAYMKFHAKELIARLSELNCQTFQFEVVGKTNINEWMGNYTPQIFIDDYEVFDATVCF